MATAPLSAVTLTETVFKPETRLVSPVTTTVESAESLVATTVTERVPKGFCTVPSTATTEPSTVIELKVFTAEA